MRIYIANTKRLPLSEKRSKIWQRRIVLKNNLSVWPTQTDWLHHLLSFSSSFLCGMVLFVVVISKTQGESSDERHAVRYLRIRIYLSFFCLEYIGTFVVKWFSLRNISCITSTCICFGKIRNSFSKGRFDMIIVCCMK